MVEDRDQKDEARDTVPDLLRIRLVSTGSYGLVGRSGEAMPYTREVRSRGVRRDIAGGQVVRHSEDAGIRGSRMTREQGRSGIPGAPVCVGVLIGYSNRMVKC